jgi:hypothetical protein
VTRLCGADHVVGARVQQRSHFIELGGGAVSQLLRLQVFPRCSLLHLETVLVHAGDEEHVAPGGAHVAGYRIGSDTLVGVADVRLAVGIGNGCCDAEFGAG